MNHFLGWRMGMTLLCAVALATAASADTLEMKDGRVINGKYLGGTQTQVRFEVNGNVELYAVQDLVALTFTGQGRSGGATAAPATSTANSASTGQRVTVPAGTRLLVRMIDGVDSEKNKVGDKFRASLEQDLTVDGTVVAPKGADVYGRLARVEEAGHISGKSQLKLELTDILIQQQLRPIVSGDYEVAGKSRGKQSAERIGGGAALGAVIGAIAGGGKGAAIGAGVGAGAGTTIQVLTKGEQVRVPSETLLEFRLEQPLSVDVSPAAGR